MAGQNHTHLIFTKTGNCKREKELLLEIKGKGKLRAAPFQFAEQMELLCSTDFHEKNKQGQMNYSAAVKSVAES